MCLLLSHISLNILIFAALYYIRFIMCYSNPSKSIIPWTYWAKINVLSLFIIISIIIMIIIIISIIIIIITTTIIGVNSYITLYCPPSLLRSPYLSTPSSCCANLVYCPLFSLNHVSLSLLSLCCSVPLSHLLWLSNPTSLHLSLYFNQHHYCPPSHVTMSSFPSLY